VRRGRPATNQSDPTRVPHADPLAGGRCGAPQRPHGCL